MSHPERFTELLNDASHGSERASASLFELVYEELRKVAASALKHERPDHTLQPTALVHEAYVRLAGEPQGRWSNRAHFLAVAARAMRRVLVDHARGHRARKRGSGVPRLCIEDIEAPGADPDQNLDLIRLDEALQQLATVDERQARIVELRFFGGLSVEETAAAVALSPRTVKREWQMARAWLKRRLSRVAAP
ncbi:MAG: sigma-70 family RNA polymerase sigma factor [Acidobacteriota bacterium]